jgi:chloride channel protein, CIC family
MIKKKLISLASSSEKNKIYALSFLVGLLTGTAAFMLKNFIHYVSHFLTRHFKASSESFFYLAYPMIGILISVLIVKYLIKDDISHGVSKILSNLSQKNTYIKAHNMFSSMITSGFTIGFGGSVGAESPIVYTGAAIGSNVSRVFNLQQNHVRLMIGCGAAGAIAGIFKAPIAGIMFALEVLMLDLTMASLIPLLISGITAATLTYYFMGETVLFHFVITTQFNSDNIPYYILLGLLSGFFSLYFTRVGMLVEHHFKRIKNNYFRLVLGGTILGLMVFIFPSLWGEGYGSINKIFFGDGPDLLNNSIFFDWKNNPNVLLLILVIILFLKVVAMAITTSSGGVGGIFAPTLFMGAIGGYILSLSLNTFFGLNLPHANFALAGMGALMAGVMHAPLLGIFLIAEITGGYQLLIPLIISVIVSYVTITRFEPHSIYTKRLAELGNLVTHHKDKAVMHYMNAKELIETDFEKVKPEMKLGQLIFSIARSKRDLFPVVDEDGMLKGMIKMNDIRNLMFDQDLYDKISVSDLMYMPEFFISPNDPMDEIVEKFNQSGRYNLAVLDEGKYIGFISKARVFSEYRDTMAGLSYD